MSEEAVKAEAKKEEPAVETPVAKEEVKKKDKVADKAAETPDAASTTEGKAADKAAETPDADSASEEEADKAAETARKKGRGKSIPAGIAFVRSTFNNTIVSIADARGGVIAWSSAGKAGFKGSRKSTAFAATMVAQDAARNAVSKGMHEVEVRIQGAGAGRESAVRAIQQAGISVSMIKDCTPIPHNGCRPRKRRRV
jgi:small subunit ribosomal protein S11